jgi:hypothetical protein
MKFEIKHRVTGAVLFSLECGSLKICVEAAIKARAYLADANLEGANLADANLAGAYLAGANLARAYLEGAVYNGPPPASKDESIANLDKVREIILDNAALLEMGHWHDENSKWQEHTCAEEAVCGTTHCLAGWLQVCSTNEDVRKLEPNIAGAICAPVAAKMFYKNNAEVREWLDKRKYAEEAE